MSMDEKIDFITNLATTLAEKGQKMNAKELAEQLNEAGFKTEANRSYNGMRGTYQLVRAVHLRLKNKELNKQAEIVAMSFVKYNGKAAWEKTD